MAVLDTLHSSSTIRLVKTFTNDSADESSLLQKIDVSGLPGAPTHLAIETIHYNVAGVAAGHVELSWGTTIADAFQVLTGSGYVDFRPFGGLRNAVSGAAATSDDVYLMTSAADVRYSITLCCRIS